MRKAADIGQGTGPTLDWALDWALDWHWTGYWTGTGLGTGLGIGPALDWNTGLTLDWTGTGLDTGLALDWYWTGCTFHLFGVLLSLAQSCIRRLSECSHQMFCWAEVPPPSLRVRTRPKPGNAPVPHRECALGRMGGAMLLVLSPR